MEVIESRVMRDCLPANFTEKMESLFERSTDAVVGMDDEHRKAHANGLAHYNRTGEGPVLSKRVKITARRRDGHEFPVELSIFPDEEAGHARRFYGFIRSLEAEERSRRELEMRAREAEVLLAVSEKLLEDISLKELVRYCLDEVCALSELDAGHLLVARGEGAARRLHPTNIWSMRNGSFAGLALATEALSFACGEGLPGQAWESGDLVVQDGIGQAIDLPRSRCFCETGLWHGLALPIKRHGEIYAVLEFYGTERVRIDTELMRLVRTLGSQIGIAIQRKQEAEDRETLRREVAHRVDNSLTILASIYRRCARKAVSISDLSKEFLGRLTAVGHASHLSLREASRGAGLHELIRGSIAVLPDAGTIQISVPEIEIESGMVLPLSLVMNELATNALKYGGLGEEAVDLVIRGEVDERGQLFLYWVERKRQPAELLGKREGFGSQLIQSMVEGRLGGTFERKISAMGCDVKIQLPLKG